MPLEILEALTRYTAYAANVQAYGATGDGTTDDRAGVQAAIDAVVAAGGGTVFFPKGTYSLSGRLQVAGSDVRLLGDQGAKLKLAAGANSCVVVFAVGVNPTSSQILSDCELAHLEIDGNTANQTARGGSSFEATYDNCAVLAVGTDRFRVRECYIHDVWATGISIQRSRGSLVQDNHLLRTATDLTQAVGARNGVSIYGNIPSATVPESRRHVVTGNVVHEFRDIGIDSLGSGTDGTVIVGNSVQGGTATSFPQWGIALEIQTSDAFDQGLSTIAGNVVRVTDTGIIVNALGTKRNRGASVTGNTILDSRGTGLHVEGNSIAVVGNVIYRHGLGGAASGNSPGINCSPNLGQSEVWGDITLSGNSIYTTMDQPGIQVASFGPDVIDGIVVADNVLRGFGSSFSSSQGQGIRVHDGSRVTITGNSVMRYQQGIRIDTGRVVISGNQCCENNDNGIRLSNAISPIVTGNLCLNNGQSTSATLRSGIVVGPGTTNAVLADNVCTDDQATKTQQYGVRADAGGGPTAGTGTVTGGGLDGNAVAPVHPTAGLVVREIGGAPGVSTKTANYTVALSDRLVLGDASAGAITISLPTAVGITGFQVTVKKVDASINTVTIDPNGAQTVDGAATRAIAIQNEAVTVVSDGANWRVV